MGPPRLDETLRRQMAKPNFPVGLETLSGLASIEVLQAGERTQIGACSWRPRALRHPGGGLAYRFSAADGVVVYACDTEHPADGPDEDLVALARDAECSSTTPSTCPRSI